MLYKMISNMINYLSHRINHKSLIKSVDNLIEKENIKNEYDKDICLKYRIKFDYSLAQFKVDIISFIKYFWKIKLQIFVAFIIGVLFTLFVLK